MPEFTLTFLQSSIINFDWTNIFREIQTWTEIKDWTEDMPLLSLQSLPGLKKMELSVYNLTKHCISQIISLSENCPSLSELR